MAAEHGRENRDVVPRWRPFGVASRTGELASYEDALPVRRRSDRAEAVAAFERDPGLYTAGDLLSHAVVEAFLDDDIAAASEFVKQSSKASPVLHEVASRSVAPADAGSIGDPSFDRASARHRVHVMKAITKREPLNAVRWVDLALAHVNLGELRAADRELKVALQLAPSNRHVLRSAARFYVLVDQPDRAHWILLRSPASAVDPWLQAAELAVSELAESTSRRVREARATLSRAAFHPRHLSELASELATAELRAGRMRHAKRYMRAALVDPTENALAQAEWASTRGVDVAEGRFDDVLWSFEAEALDALGRGEYSDALRAGQAWQLDQPFAGDAAMFTSYAATVGAEDWQLGASSARQGLVASPNDAMLRNNLVFSLANLGDVAGSLEQLAKLPRHIENPRHRATVFATKGLVAFRLGEPDLGRRLYLRAAEIFRLVREPERERIARVLLAREELLAGVRPALEVVEIAKDLARGTKTGEVLLWRQRIEDAAEATRDQQPTPHRQEHALRSDDISRIFDDPDDQ